MKNGRGMTPTSFPRRGAHIAVICVLLLAACGKRYAGDATADRSETSPSSVLDEGVTLFTQCRFDEALPLLERAAEVDSGNSSVHAWLAAGYFRLHRPGEADAAARRALALDGCNSHAHTILATTYNPQYSPWPQADADTTWKHLHAAIACDSSNGDAWMGSWGESLRRGRIDMADTALRYLVRTGFLTPTLLAYNRWMLRHLPRNALLITNGDMDTYPALAVQLVEGFRRDVVLVNQSLLNTPWYQRYIRDYHEVPLLFSDAALDSLQPFRGKSGEAILVTSQIFLGWVLMKDNGSFTRPIAVSTTVPLEYGAQSLRFVMCGAYRLCSSMEVGGAVDTAAVRRSLESIDPDEFSGSCVSVLDHSPVRITYSDQLVSNVTVTAMQYAMALIDAGRASDAFDVLTWAEEFEKGTAAGPVHAGLIADFKKRIRTEMRKE